MGKLPQAHSDRCRTRKEASLKTTSHVADSLEQRSDVISEALARELDRHHKKECVNEEHRTFFPSPSTSTYLICNLRHKLLKPGLAHISGFLPKPMLNSRDGHCSHVNHQCPLQYRLRLLGYCCLLVLASLLSSVFDRGSSVVSMICLPLLWALVLSGHVCNDDVIAIRFLVSESGTTDEK